MSFMNASVHDLHHCTKLQLSTTCSFGVMTQTRHKFPEIQSGKSARYGSREGNFRAGDPQ